MIFTKKNIYRTFLFACVMLFALPHTTFAQVGNLIIDSTLPATPGPNQDVTVSIQSYAVNLDASEIIWYVNKVPTQEGVALRSINVRTGDIGETTSIDILIKGIDGKVINHQINITPAEIDVLWEALTYTPPFYKGKALPGFESNIRLIAIPRAGALASDPSKYFYKWTYDRFKVVGEALGLSSVIIPSGWADAAVPVNLAVSLPGSSWSGTKYLDIHGAETKLLFYEDAPLLGTRFDRALTGVITSKESPYAFRAVPYFFSQNDFINRSLRYDWKINNRRATPDINPSNFVLNNMESGLASYTVSLDLVNPKHVLQQGAAAIGVSFESNTP